MAAFLQMYEFLNVPKVFCCVSEEEVLSTYKSIAFDCAILKLMKELHKSSHKQIHYSNEMFSKGVAEKTLYFDDKYFGGVEYFAYVTELLDEVWYDYENKIFMCFIGSFGQTYNRTLSINFKECRCCFVPDGEYENGYNVIDDDSIIGQLNKFITDLQEQSERVLYHNRVLRMLSGTGVLMSQRVFTFIHLMYGKYNR